MPTDRPKPIPRICIVTSAHPTDDVRVYSKFALSLLTAGYDVTWVGPSVAYFAESVEVDSRIRYRLFNVSISRASRLLGAWRAWKTARRLASVPIDWWYAPDPDAVVVATALARRRGGRVVFDIHEMFHGPSLRRWTGGRDVALINGLVRRGLSLLCRQADVVVAVSNSVLECYVQAGPRALVVRSCAPDWYKDDPDMDHRERAGEAATCGVEPMRVIHGKLIPQNGTPVVLDALDLPGGMQGIEVVMFDVLPDEDPFASAARQRISRRLDGVVAIRVPIPHHEMPLVLKSAAVGMIAYGRGLGENSLPNRLFEYMAAGLAILAPSYAQEITLILDRDKVGITADFDDPQDVTRALVWLRDHPEERRAMGRRARRVFVERYSWEREFQRFAVAIGGA